jgi:hypothetical protein
VLLIRKVVFLTAIFAQILFAQSNDLAVTLQPVSNSDVNWETTLTITGQSGLENGLLIELPAGVKMVPLNAQINQNTMFLQNINDVPTRESLICWNLNDDGLILFFSEGQFSSADQLVITTMTTQISKRIADNPTINIKAAQGNTFSEEIKASTVLSLQSGN